ncbi:T-complex protein 1 subunit gamma-like [Vitis riparia]|uniref:T-complex protein 1 subunit gamma-like n=1 Tax=Vitis riparia TaxID=96939 RepID=UPI00155A5677|nr:T-complex protein 1 subunit gamma-like [Vitis riparia]
MGDFEELFGSCLSYFFLRCWILHSDWQSGLGCFEKIQAPVLVLKNSLKRETGSKMQHANIQASRVVAAIICTTLGPQSLLKMLLDAGEGFAVTNDGNVILQELDLAHPTAKSMVELNRTQDE